MKKKIVIFSGAGISAESGVETFRGLKNGLWNNHKIDDVATPSGWKKSRENVLDFYNERRQQLPQVEPNAAHEALVQLEEYYDVTVITQNVDDLHERAGSTSVIHLHGELTKACDCMSKKNVYNIGYNNIPLGLKCPENGSQPRPYIVWFEEMPNNVDEAYTAIYHADILLVIGTSLQISYTLDLLRSVRQTFEGTNEPCRIIYIDPSPKNYLDNYGLKVEYVRKGAVEGVSEIVNELLN